MNNHAPFLARYADSDRVANAPMLHEIILDQNRRSLDVTLITKFDTIFDADHRNSLFAPQVLAITFFVQGWDYLAPQIYFWETCYAYHNDEDIRSVLYLRAAASSDLYGR